MLRPNLFRDCFFVYVLLTAVRTLPQFKVKAGAQKNLKVLFHQRKNSGLLKEVLFAVALPRSYSLWNRRFPKSVIPAVLSSPLLQLIEPSLRRTLAVYVATTAVVNIVRGSRQRKNLPPAWTLIFIANSWLLWAFLFHPKCFPRGYGNLILRHSNYGCSESAEQLVRFLQQTKFGSYSPDVSPSSHSVTSLKIHPSHTRAVCAHLHPTTPSCLKTYINAWLTQLPRVFKWVGPFSALTLLLQRRELYEKPEKILATWFISTMRGTIFVVGTINTCWGLTCFFQRILRPETLPRIRWIANALLGNVWVLVLPPQRRTAVALYCARLTIVSGWDLLSEWCPKYGEALVLALSWSSLLRDRCNGRGPRGLGGAVLDYMDSHIQSSSAR